MKLQHWWRQQPSRITMEYWIGRDPGRGQVPAVAGLDVLVGPVFLMPTTCEKTDKEAVPLVPLNRQLAS